MKLFEKEISFISNQLYLVLLSIVLTAGSLFLVFYHGLQFGIDFTGGVKLQYQLNQTVEVAKLQDLFAKEFPEKVVVQVLGDPKENKFVLNIEKPQKIEDISALATGVLKKQYGESSVTFIGGGSIGPKAGSYLRINGQKAVIFAWLLILAYIWFRFDFYFAPGAIIALIHDLIIVLGAFAVTGREISLAVVAAFLTIIGYSVNDTIIVFDRVRENAPKLKNLPLPQLVNRSINETLSRTIVTSLTMFFVVIVLFFKGQGEIKDFAFAMIIGVVTGTYSSIFIASPTYLFLKKLAHRFGWEK